MTVSLTLFNGLFASAQAKHQVKSTLFLNVVVAQRATILQLLACEDQALLVWWNAFLVLNLCLDVVDGVACLNIQSDRLAGQSLHEDLHATAEAQHQVERGLLLDVVVRQRAAYASETASSLRAL